jgi:hypothetical protein
MVSGEDLFHGVQGTGANVAINDAECRQCKSGLLRLALNCSLMHQKLLFKISRWVSSRYRAQRFSRAGQTRLGSLLL